MQASNAYSFRCYMIDNGGNIILANFWDQDVWSDNSKPTPKWQTHITLVEPSIAVDLIANGIMTPAACSNVGVGTTEKGYLVKNLTIKCVIWTYSL